MLWIWLLIVVFLILIELATVNLVTIWYIASAVVSMILSIFIHNYLIQFLVFIILCNIIIVNTHEYFIVKRENNEK